MHTVELLERALDVARRAGYRIRHDWLDGPGGAFELAGQKWLVLDLSQGPSEQLGIVLDALGADGRNAAIDAGPELRRLLDYRTRV